MSIYRTFLCGKGRKSEKIQKKIVWGILSFMVISYHGGECFKISFGDTTLALNPISKDSKLKKIRFGADIALISLNDDDFNGVDQVAHGDKSPFAIVGPGEYEARKVFIRGIPSVSHYGGTERINTIYIISLEGINLCFLGALGTRKINAETKELLGDIDVLFVPIGGDGVLNPSEAHELSVELQPHIIIPMHYDGIGNKDALSVFLKEESVTKNGALDKLTLKKRDLENKEGEVIVLSS